jgi:hypothetical protein
MAEQIENELGCPKSNFVRKLFGGKDEHTVVKFYIPNDKIERFAESIEKDKYTCLVMRKEGQEEDTCACLVCDPIGMIKLKKDAYSVKRNGNLYEIVLK